MDVISLTVAIISLFAAVSMPFIYDRLRAPKLSVIIPDSDPSIQPLPSARRGFYHVMIVNKNVELKGRRIFWSHPSYLTKIGMKFMDKRRRRLFELNGRWDRAPEPLAPGIAGGRVVHLPDHSLVPISETIDISPGRGGEGFCLVMKYEGEDECWGFSNWSYLRGWQQGLRDPQSKLGIGKYIIDVHITASNAERSFRFILENRGKRLEDVSIKGPYTF